MPPFHPFSHPPPFPSLSLSQRLDRLAQTFDAMGRQLREDIARAVAQTVAESVHQALRNLLGNADGRQDRRDMDDRWPQRQHAPPSWRDADPWAEAAEDEDLQDELPDYDRARLTAPSSNRSPSGHWVTSLVAGVNAARWWKGKKPGRSLLTTLAIGLAVSLFALTATSGSLLGLAASAFTSFALTDVASSGTSFLAGLVH